MCTIQFLSDDPDWSVRTIMRILLVNDTDKEFGGAEKYMFTLAKLLLENGHQVEIFGSQKFNTNLSYISRIYNISDCFRLTNLLKAFQPDIVHVHKINLALSPSILRVIKRFNIPVVMTVHDFHYVCPDDWLIDNKDLPCYHGFNVKCVFSNCYRSKISWKYKGLRIYHVISLLLHRTLLKKYVDQFIVPSNSLAQMMRGNLCVKNVSFVPNIIWLNSNLCNTPISDCKRLLFIGRLSKEKGAEYLINAMPKILECFPDTELTLIGKGPEEHTLKNMVRKLGIERNVRFRGFVSEDNLAESYLQAELVVVPSFWAENNPIVCLEAMAHGRPVIASNLFGLSELIDDEDIGTLFNPGDAVDLAHKIIAILSDFDKVQKMSANSREKSLSFTSNQNHYDNIIKIYKNAIRQSCLK